MSYLFVYSATLKGLIRVGNKLLSWTCYRVSKHGFSRKSRQGRRPCRSSCCLLSVSSRAFVPQPPRLFIPLLIVNCFKPALHSTETQHHHKFEPELLYVSTAERRSKGFDARGNNYEGKSCEGKGCDGLLLLPSTETSF